MITFPYMEQCSPEWFELRAGRPTASEFDKIVTSTGKTSTQRQAYLYRLAGEMVLGTTEQTHETPWMARGKELEAEARAVYQMENETEVDQVGFCLHDSEKFGCSPDGLIGDDGGLEIKCPSLAVFVEYTIGGRVPSKYVMQVQGSLLVTGRKWWDFFAYYPGMKPFIFRAEPIIRIQRILNDELDLFCEDLETVTKKLMG